VTVELPDESASRYLLGAMTEEERDAFETRMLGDPELSELVAAAEADLLDAYVRGELDAEQRRIVQQHLLATDAQRARLDSAVALNAALEPRRRSHWWWTVPIAAALAVVVLVALLQQRRPAPSSESRPVIARVTTAPPTPPTPVPSDTGGKVIVKEPVVVTLVLASSMTRGERAEATLTLPANADTVRLVMGLEPGDDEYPSYGVLVQTVDGSEIAKRDRLASKKGVLQIDLPARSLGAGEYEVLVEGFPSGGAAEPLGDWPFVVRP
jgi:hypothetical protein